MKRILTIVTLLLSLGCRAQVFYAWAKGMGGTNYEQGQATAVDAGGNVYTVGLFAGTVDFDPGPATFTISSFSSFNDVFVSKLSATGTFIWAKQLGGLGTDFGYGIALDGSGNVYLTGSFNATADFDPGPGTYTLSPPGGNAAFLCKLSSAGNFVWTKAFTASQGLAVAVDGGTSLYTTGDFTGTSDLDPGPSTYTVTSAGSTDAYISRFDTAGNFMWGKVIGGSGADHGYSISPDGSGNVLTSGAFHNTIDLDPGAGTATVTSAGGFDCFISKLDASGNYVWGKTFGGTGDDTDYGVTVDGTGNVYSTGSFSMTVDFDPGPGTYTATSAGSTDIFMSKLDPSGNFIWARTFGGSGAETALAIAKDLSGVYSTGFFAGTPDFDPGPGTYTINSNGGNDIYVNRLDQAGNFAWAVAAGGTGTDCGRGIAADAPGNVYITGNYQTTVDFDPSISTATLTAAGGSDIFVWKLAQPTLGVTEIVPSSLPAIFPNPGGGAFSLDVSPDLQGKKSFIVYNGLGQQIHEQELNEGMNSFIMRNCADGIYHYVVLLDGKKIGQGKLVISQ